MGEDSPWGLFTHPTVLVQQAKDVISDFSAATVPYDVLVFNLEKLKGVATWVAFEVALVVVHIPLERMQRIGYGDFSIFS